MEYRGVEDLWLEARVGNILRAILDYIDPYGLDRIPPPFGYSLLAYILPPNLIATLH
jgi:hypothetical protein